MSKWYKNKENFLYEIENEEHGLCHLMYRKIDDIEHYAIVNWVYGNCYLVVEFSNGKVLKEIE